MPNSAGSKGTGRGRGAGKRKPGAAGPSTGCGKTGRPHSPSQEQAPAHAGWKLTRTAEHARWPPAVGRMSKQAWGHHQARSHQRGSPTQPAPPQAQALVSPPPCCPQTSEGPCLTSFKHEGGRCLVINRTGSKSLELLRWKRLAQGRECSVLSSGSTAVRGPLPPHLWDHEDATGLCPSCPAESHRGKGCPPHQLDLIILYIFRNG